MDIFKRNQGMMVNVPIAYQNENGQTILDIKESIRPICGNYGLYCYIRVGRKKVKLFWNKNFGGFIENGLLFPMEDFDNEY